MVYTYSLRRKQTISLRQFCWRFRKANVCAHIAVRLWQYGLENFVDSVIVSKVSNEPAASFSVYAMKMTAADASEKLVTPYQTVGYDRSGDRNLNTEKCVKFRAACSHNESKLV
jgi:hypothetical protein